MTEYLCGGKRSNATIALCLTQIRFRADVQDIGLGLFDVPDERLARAVDAETPGEIHPAGPATNTIDELTQGGLHTVNGDNEDERGDDDCRDPIAKALQKRASGGTYDNGAGGTGAMRREKRGRLIQEVEVEGGVT